MRPLLIGFAYLLIYTTPIQGAMLIWVIWIITTTDTTLLAFNGHQFWLEHLVFLQFAYHWLYTWFWNDLLNLIFALPIALVIGFKILINTWLGFWLLPFAKAMRTPSQ